MNEVKKVLTETHKGVFIMRKGNHFTGYVVIAMIAMFHMMLIGCNSETSTSVPTGSAAVAEVGDEVSDGKPVYSEDCELASYYNRPEMDKWIQTVEEKGYRFSCMYSFSIAGYVQPEGFADSIFGRVTTLAFVSRSQPASDAQYLDICEVDSVWSVVNYELVFDESLVDAEYYKITEGVWRKDLSAKIYVRAGRQMQVIAQGDKLSDYLDCVRKWSTIYCIASLIVCAAAGPGFPECAAAGCAGGIITAGIRCLFD